MERILGKDDSCLRYPPKVRDFVREANETLQKVQVVGWGGGVYFCMELYATQFVDAREGLACFI